MRIAVNNGANKTVVQLFSVFHDSCRYDEGIEPQHGPRGADFRHIHFEVIPDNELYLLHTACPLHTSAATHKDITVQTCVDSDRLDLGRVGIPSLIQYVYAPMLLNRLI